MVVVTVCSKNAVRRRGTMKRMCIGREDLDARL